MPALGGKEQGNPSSPHKALTGRRECVVQDACGQARAWLGACKV